MRRTFFLSAAMLASIATAVGAQTPKTGIKLSDVAGIWHAKIMVGPKDSVATTMDLTATADDKGWLMTALKGAPVAVRVVTTGGDSVVTEAGPYPSILRPGQTVTLLRMIGHYKGNQMTGTFAAQYAGGDKTAGKIAAMRGK